MRSKGDKVKPNQVQKVKPSRAQVCRRVGTNHGLVR